MEYDNPAARLFSILDQGKRITTSISCRKAWTQILEVDDPHSPLLIARLGKAMELPEVTIQAIKDSFPSQEGKWAYWESKVNKAFASQNLNSTWDSFITHIDDHCMTYLHMHCDMLQAKSTTKSISDGDIAAVRDRLNQLYEETLKSDVEEQVKKYLVRYLRKLIVSLDEYRLTGALPILESVETMIGHVHVDKNYMQFLKDTELGGRLFETLTAMANVVTVAVGLPQLSQVVPQVILQLPG